MSIFRRSFLTSLRIVPNNVFTHTISQCVNHLLRGQAIQLRFLELEGKSIALNISDIQMQCHFTIQKGQLKLAPADSSDVTITGDINAFWQLARQQEDPDTLFFKRSLNIEGETETGVHIKNILDSLEYSWDAHFDDVLIPPMANIAKGITYKVRSIVGVGSNSI
jgi:O2-independent ubiquinone biosynthesis accessory factor UbiT